MSPHTRSFALHELGVHHLLPWLVVLRRAQYGQTEGILAERFPGEACTATGCSVRWRRFFTLTVAKIVHARVLDDGTGKRR